MGLAVKNAKCEKKAWPMVRLGDVCEINLGKTPPRGSRDCWDPEKSSGNVWVSISDMSNLIGGKIDDSKEYITRYAIESVGVPVVSKGTLLLSFKLTLGRTAIAGCDLYTNEAIAALPVKNDFKRQIDIPFLSTYFAFFDWNGFAAKDEKLLGKTLNKKKLAEIPIPLPPLSVQREIVARLEKELGEADALAAKFKEIAENADAEFKAELDETFKNVEGEKVRLGDVCEFMRRGKSPTYCESSPYPMFAQKCNQPTHITLEKCKFCESSKFLKFSKEYRMRDYDIVVNSTGTGTLGRVGLFRSKYLVPYGYEAIVADSHVMIVRPSEQAVPAYLYWYMKQDWVYQWMNESANGSTNQKELYPQTLGRLEVPLTNVVTQRAISTKLDAVREKCDRLKAAAERGLRAAEDLRKAILAEAFEQ